MPSKPIVVNSFCALLLLLVQLSVVCAVFPIAKLAVTRSLCVLSLLPLLLLLMVCAMTASAAGSVRDDYWSGSPPPGGFLKATGGWMIPIAQLMPGTNTPPFAFVYLTDSARANNNNNNDAPSSNVDAERYCRWMGYSVPASPQYRATDRVQRPHLHAVSNYVNDYIYQLVEPFRPNNITKVIVEPRCRLPHPEMCGGELFRPGQSQNFSRDAQSPRFPMRVETYDPSRHALVLVNCGAWVPPPPRSRITTEVVSYPALVIDQSWLDATLARADLRAALVRYVNRVIKPLVQRYIVGLTYSEPCKVVNKNFVASGYATVSWALAEITHLSKIFTRYMSSPAEVGGNATNFLVELAFSFDFHVAAHVKSEGWVNICPKKAGVRIEIFDWCECKKHVRLCDAPLHGRGRVDCTVKVGLNDTGFVTAKPTCTQGGRISVDGLENCGPRLPWIARRMSSLFDFSVADIQRMMSEELSQKLNDPATLQHPLVQSAQGMFQALWPQSINITNQYMGETTLQCAVPKARTTLHPDFRSEPRDLGAPT